MPRPKRADEAGAIYHVLNRGNARRTVFHKPFDYQAFESVIAEGLERFAVQLLAYQWMPNHWHMVLSPRINGAMSAFMCWTTMTHTQRYHAHYGTAGQGHIYQGRYKSFPVQGDSHFLTLCRYVERNALTAGLVDQAEKWQWGSLWNLSGGQTEIALENWPISRPQNWLARVNKPLSEKESSSIQQSIQRSSPYGDQKWTESTASRLGLQSTLRRRGRPSKFAQNTK